MRVLIAFIQRNFNLLLFIGLETLCLILFARSNSLQGNAVMNSANTGIAFFYNKKQQITQYFGLSRMNDSLLSENRRLHQLLASHAEWDLLKDSSGKHQITNPDDSAHKVTYAHYLYKTARVVNNSVNGNINYITINRGHKDGISPNMALVSSTGVVGRVLDVSEHFATALSILNTKQRLSAKLKDGTSSFVYWEQRYGANTLLMKVTQADIKIAKGDSVLTTSYSTIFPADMLIGTVDRIFVVKKDNSRLLHIKTATNFHNLQFIYAIKNDYIDERRLLEDSSKAKQSKLEAPKR